MTTLVKALSCLAALAVVTAAYALGDSCSCGICKPHAAYPPAMPSSDPMASNHLREFNSDKVDSIQMVYYMGPGSEWAKGKNRPVYIHHETHASKDGHSVCECTYKYTLLPHPVYQKDKVTKTTTTVAGKTYSSSTSKEKVWVASSKVGVKK